MVLQNKSSVSALIATILLIVVAVALVAILLTWGKSFTTNSVSEVDTFKDASSTYFIKPVQLVNGSLIFKNISTVKEDITITGYKIIANDPDTNQEIQYLETPIVLSQGSQDGIRIPSLPTDKTFTVQLYTNDGKYIDVRNITNTGSALTSIQEEIIFAKVFGGAGFDGVEKSNSLLQTSDGGYLVLGNTYSFGAGNVDIYLLKTDLEGNLDWNKTFGGSNQDYSTQVLETSDGGYLVLGVTDSFGAGSSDIYLLKTDLEGNLDWNKTFGGSNQDYSTQVLETSDGGYLVLGYTYSFGPGTPNNSNSYLLKIDLEGNLDWNKTFGGINVESSTKILETSDGGYLVLGYTYSFGAGGVDIYLLKTDLEGNTDWNKTFGGSNHEDSTQVLETSDGGYLVLGYTQSFGAENGDIYLIKTDLEGNLDWNKTFGGSNYEYPTQVLETSDGGYLVLGYTYSFGAGGNDIYLIKTNASGNLDWNKTFGGSSGEESTQVLETSNGYFIFGRGQGYVYDDEYDYANYYIIKTDLNGNSLTEKIIGGKGTDYLYSVVPTTEGGFLLGGLTFSFGSQVEDNCDAQILIVKIDSEGNYNISNLIESLYWQGCDY